MRRNNMRPFLSAPEPDDVVGSLQSALYISRQILKFKLGCFRLDGVFCFAPAADVGRFAAVSGFPAPAICCCVKDHAQFWRVSSWKRTHQFRARCNTFVDRRLRLPHINLFFHRLSSIWGFVFLQQPPEAQSADRAIPRTTIPDLFELVVA